MNICSFIKQMSFSGQKYFGRIRGMVIIKAKGAVKQMYAFFVLFDNPPFPSGYQYTGTLANGEDLDKMPHNLEFHQCLNCLLCQNNLQGQKILEFRNFDQ